MQPQALHVWFEVQRLGQGRAEQRKLVGHSIENCTASDTPKLSPDWALFLFVVAEGYDTQKKVVSEDQRASLTSNAAAAV